MSKGIINISKKLFNQHCFNIKTTTDWEFILVVEPGFGTMDKEYTQDIKRMMLWVQEEDGKLEGWEQDNKDNK